MRNLLLLALLCLIAATGYAQNKKKIDPDAGYLPTVAPEDKKKKKAEETQVLALPPELPAAVTAQTNRLAFQVTPLSAKGLLSQQTRDALKGLLRSNRGTIVKLRAFVAGSGDLRRVAEIAGEMFQEKHQALPALSAVQVGALPLEGAQVEIEATEVDRKVVNPNGVVFIAAQPAASVGESLSKLKMLASDALAVTCFASSFDSQRDTATAMSAAFPGAALDYVQMQRAPVTPAASCEAVARAVKPGGPSEIVITGTQLAFGSQDNDLKLALGRLDKALAVKGASLNHAVLANLYVTSTSLSDRVLALAPSAAARSVLPVEALPSLDSSFALDVIAESDSSFAHSRP
ncbi:MAG TPA: Rid family hydrolase [Bryobacteraceae bacterium]|nr:Rid family hydrolase [Bryobacteraceae bacterium]